MIKHLIRFLKQRNNSGSSLSPRYTSIAALVHEFANQQDERMTDTTSYPRCSRCNRMMVGVYAPESGELCKPCLDLDSGKSALLPFPGTDAETFIQWKGTQVCMDVWCFCGESVHIDADFAYFIKCHGCSAVYEVGTQVKLRRLEEDESPSMEPRMDSDTLSQVPGLS